VNPLEHLLNQVANLFERQGQGWALVGGLAVSVRSEPRFTRDLDVAVADEADLELACDAARLIEKRGYNRSRNVIEAVSNAWCEFRCV
jgi:hypothetical protein